MVDIKKVLRTYRQTIFLMLGIIIGSIIGIIYKEKVSVLKPFGDIFINMMFVIIVPLIFLTITNSIAKMNSNKRLGKLMISIISVFFITSVIALTIGFLSIYKIKLFSIKDLDNIKSNFSYESKLDNNYSILEKTKDVLTVDDFKNLLSKEHIIALLVFSIIFGIAIRKSKRKMILNVIDDLNEVIFKFIRIIMYYAPIGLGCYFANLVGTLGSTIATGFLKTFILYSIISILYYFIVYSIYAFLSGGKIGVKKYFKNIIPATVVSLSTCSSAASIPINTECSKKIGVSSDIADTMIPLGTSFHKDGSIIGSVFKIMFLVNLFGTDMPILKIFIVAFIANLLISAVPIGGGTISEMMIISLMGFPVEALPILTIIATIIDPLATMLNVVGDTSSSMIVSRIMDGKNSLINKEKIEI